MARMKKLNKYQNGGDPPKKKPYYLQYQEGFPLTGWQDPYYGLDRTQAAITRDSTRLADAWFPSFMDEEIKNLQINREYRDKMKSYTDQELRGLNYNMPPKPKVASFDTFLQDYNSKGIPEETVPEYGMGGDFLAGLAGGVLGSVPFVGESLQKGVGNIATKLGADMSSKAANFGGAAGAVGSALVNPMGAMGNVGKLGKFAGMLGFEYGGAYMKQDMGQDANVESGEIMFSENGGQFNSMNPSAPIDEIAPGVSLVKGNVDNDNVPVQLPGGDKTYILSKKLGYADEALEVVNKYKELHDLPDSNDYIENQTRKLNMNKLKSQLKAIFDKQEASKPKQANQGGIPQANLGDVIGKGINALDKFGKTGAGQFLTNNLDSMYNLGMAAFAKDPELINAADYQTDYVPQEYQMDVSALMSPYKDAMASARYGIGQSGGSAAEIIAGNAAMASGMAPAMASQIGQMHAEKSRFDAEQYANKFKADQANRSIAYDIDRANEERLAQRQQFLKEGISGVQDYFQGKRRENFMKDHAGFGMYNSAGQLNSPVGSLIGGNFGIGSNTGEEDYNWLQGVQLPGNFE